MAQLMNKSTLMAKLMNNPTPTLMTKQKKQPTLMAKLTNKPTPTLMAKQKK